MAGIPAPLSAELAQNEPAVGQLLALLKAGPVTLLYGARDTEHNQAVVLRDYLSERANAR